MMMRVPESIAVFIILLSVLAVRADAQFTHIPTFDGESAYDYLLEQCFFGPRPPGSENLTLCRLYISETLESIGWNVTLQNFTYKETICTNIIATWNSSVNTSVILGAHYDTRPNASAETNQLNRNRPVLGANDGGSGTAVLMELARVLPESTRSEVEIVFFDAEDSGGINGWNWIQGSTFYVSQLNITRRESIRAMVLVDMVGDSDLNLKREGHSTLSLQNAIWSIASQMGYGDVFVQEAGGSVLDDHKPFLDADIPAVDLIQTPFPAYWHTLEDTPDKCSAESLEIVGSVLEVFIVEHVASNGTYPPDTPYLVYAAIIIVPGFIILVLYLHRKQQGHVTSF